MKKICVFTQTYGSNRQELYKYHNNDKSDLMFRNNFENLYSFHNSPDDYYQSIINNNYFSNLNNINMVRYNNMSYTESFKKTLNYLIENKFEYIIFLQDDCFNLSEGLYIEELIEFINNNSFEMLNLEKTPDDLGMDNSEIFLENNKFIVYNTSSEDFKNKGLYAFDDGAYVSSIRFILENIYDDNYFKINDIWQSEKYLNEKIKQKRIQRLTANINFYKRVNIVGPNNWDRSNNITLLNNKFN